MLAWKTFARGKWRRPAVQQFWICLEQELDALYHELKNECYRHGQYRHFVIQDAKRRDVYVAGVRDKVVHQLVSSYLAYRYANHFYAHSYAAQVGKGVSAARMYALSIIRRLQAHHQVWVGKLDVKKYFAHIRHGILLQILSRRITDERILRLCRSIIESFGRDGCGLPLGNVTSQWFANIYLHELDWHAKYALKIPYYLRYNDDMLVFATNREEVVRWSHSLVRFAKDILNLSIPPEKTSIAGLPQAIDILGWCTNGDRVWVRQATMRRARAKLKEKYLRGAPEILDAMSSYYGAGMPIALLYPNLYV